MAATARLGVSARLGRERGLLGGKKQAPDAIIVVLFSGSGWAVCAVARWVNTHFHHCLTCDPSPRGEAISPVLWLIGHPWPKEAAIHAAAPPSRAHCRTTAIGDGESDSDDGVGMACSQLVY